MSPTGGSSAAAHASGAEARWSRPTGSSRCVASGMTSARWRPASNAASAWRRSTTSRRATSSSATRRRRSAAPFPRKHSADELAPGQRVVSCPPRSEAELREAIGPRFRVSQRTQRLDELLRQEIGAMLEREIADPRIGFATVTSVETTPDLRHARVWVSIIGGDAQREGTIAALEHAMVFVRRELGTRLRLKRIPDLHVRLDDSIERGTRVLKLIESLESGGEPAVVPEGESLPTPSRQALAGDVAAGTPPTE